MAFNFLKKAGKGLVSDVKGGLNVLSASFIKPKTTLSGIGNIIIGKKEKGSKQIISGITQTKALPKSQRVMRTLQSTVIAGAGVAAAPFLRTPVKGLATSLGKKAAAKPLKTAIVGTITIPTAIGVFSRPKARSAAGKVATNVFNPIENIKRGGAAVDIITRDKNLPKNLKTGLKTAGIVGAGAALIGGGIFLKNKIKSIIPEKKPKDIILTPENFGSAVPITPTIPIEGNIGTVQTPKPKKPVSGVKVSQKVNVNQKVYKAGSIDVKVVKNGKRSKKKKKRKTRRT